VDPAGAAKCNDLIRKGKRKLLMVCSAEDVGMNEAYLSER